ncbi:hypothetical protein GOP47_0012316 [Adiantum capillus-veneris]|uniref:Uncharacterized protein n=1 Tax=Adiantum capillus-veneris TaxID=13818 RepID=A0A9D4UQG0_ADICA|nr:hypothetical protein GOP47_0012316 [Adiantum capillus-veneris]
MSKRTRVDGEDNGRRPTPDEFKGPSPLVRRAEDLRMSVLGQMKEPFRWRPTRVSNKWYRMTVTAMVGNVEQTSEKFGGALSQSCALLACSIAEWLLLHPGFSAPSSDNLDAIFDTVLLMQEQFTKRDVMPNIEEVLEKEFKGRLKMTGHYGGVLEPINELLEIRCTYWLEGHIFGCSMWTKTSNFGL